MEIKYATKNRFDNIKLVFRIYILALVFFSFFRLILFYTQKDKLGASSSVSDILYAFFMGIRFDTVITCYILSLAYILLTIRYLFNIQSAIFNKIIFGYTFLIFSLAFIVCGADIPYFNQFFSRFSVTAFAWIDSPMFVAKLIFQEPKHWLYFIPITVFIVLFYRRLKRILSTTSYHGKPDRIVFQSIISILFVGVIILGMRGRLDEKSPIRVGTAYFGNDPLLNQLGLNPNFTLLRSYLDSKDESNEVINLMPDSIAIANTQHYLDIVPYDSAFPLLRKENVHSNSAEYKNIVIVLMESMSAAQMKRHGNPYNLTPFLDSLSNEGFYFDNFYSAGIHTFNGVFSTLFSYPALFRQHPMKESGMFHYHGIASALKKLGYTTTYFTTHDGQFDNIEGFLKANDFENVISKKDYPSDKAKTTLGVPDDFMFEFSMPLLDKMNESNKPFLAVYMTASNHTPYYIPDYFKPKQQDKEKQIVEFADYSLKKLIQLSSQKKWFNNTLFVFVADHGYPLTVTYDISLDYHHIPLLFYAPDIIKNKKTFTVMGGQVDIFPSIMGLLHLPYDNNTLGINLFTKERPYIYTNNDDKYAVIDNDWLLIVKQEGEIGLYKYRNNDLTNYATQMPELVTNMKTYAESQMQAFQYVLKKQKM
ncbi:MAG: sulfatase-like hydrolase/transferase [Chitinophagaceae bacterium]|nr:sulfatase-like hydrolase/transferase [Chitinophagaceae bacterium]MCW5904547.1 sulfatase-like hydrolase/transferase [Chitinophagaceae bacterium]